MPCAFNTCSVTQTSAHEEKKLSNFRRWTAWQNLFRPCNMLLMLSWKTAIGRMRHGGARKILILSTESENFPLLLRLGIKLEQISHTNVGISGRRMIIGEGMAEGNSMKIKFWWEFCFSGKKFFRELQISFNYFPKSPIMGLPTPRSKKVL